ncbi:type II toxin-antitoxin system VapB family antitoxin [Desulfofundulus thermosubterraneus]|uniref:Antitoxin of type II TA system, VapB n=1 Tax=Desulfofundulus thermosubterraneus DSM 16057 TaxID=1121432 RepID=A0A1M6JEC6_9FIRM|nr:type II toxin-antitoxin system VapB family antitoxin [Desulfofundulus thermosubterraneus]SHJ45015.1 antitoxin of type II TA system, VapB [Desulfofundulus thermosubterraneus DSM 16057]
MKTTLYVNRKLLREAMELAGLKGITETIEAALTEFVRRKRLEKLAASLGRIDLELNDSALEEIRRDE